MKRLAGSVVAIATLLLLIPAAGFAATAESSAGLAPLVPPSLGESSPSWLTLHKLRLATDGQTRSSSLSPYALTTTLPGPCTVTGQILDVAGGPLSDVWVNLFYSDADAAWWFDAVATDVTGSFTFSGVPETTDGQFLVYLNDGNTLQSWGNSFTAAGPNNFVLQPGLLGAELTLTSGSTWTPPMIVDTWGSSGGATTEVDGASGQALAMPTDCDYAVAYPRANQGIEWWPSSPVNVVAGSLGATMTFDQADARGARISSPLWRSGKPGTTVKIVLDNWPAGYTIGFTGLPSAPTGLAKFWSPTISSGAQPMTRSLVIPSTAPAGYTYGLDVSRDDSGSQLVLNLEFQVATLKSSRSWIYKGGSFRLSGTVPTEGHWGTTPGKSKYVVLYKRTTSAGQPSKWDATLNGWTKVGTYKANGYGKYVTGLLSPSRTTWYIVRYPGDTEYFRAFTSVLKVPVQ